MVPAGSRAFVLALLLLCGCSEQQQEQNTVTPNADSELLAPQLSISCSQTSALEPGDEITLQIATQNFVLDISKANQAAEPRVGHYRVYWDKDPNAEPIAIAADPTITINIPAETSDGSHQLRVVLYNNDHTPLDPPVEAMQWILVYEL
jgi:uncharacterized protein YcfL